MLAVQAMTPNALAAHFDTTRQAISKHIRVLAECQLVRQELKGREIHYHLNGKKMKEVADWIEPFRALWDKRFAQLDDVLNTLKHKR
jgi:DNA-binding transcriptional ArsR family regulator